MLFFIFLAILVAGIIFLVLYDKTYDDWMDYLGMFLTVVGAIAIFISIVIIGVSNITASATVAANVQRYNAITYEITSGLYEDDLNILDNGILQKAADWNADLAVYKELQRDFWVGIYVPNVYDQFEIIDYKVIKKVGK